ncbi:hypothetical protein NQZ68_035108 [Dissostichus eleginoides]|nr:hypothetical protein NQZ68_035108 [Dissostichus eleginoides]
MAKVFSPMSGSSLQPGQETQDSFNSQKADHSSRGPPYLPRDIEVIELLPAVLITEARAVCRARFKCSDTAGHTQLQKVVPVELRVREKEVCESEEADGQDTLYEDWIITGNNPLLPFVYLLQPLCVQMGISLCCSFSDLNPQELLFRRQI